MPYSPTSKRELIEKYKRGPNDTGSAEVQIALLTERIKQITAHLQKFRKDYQARRGLLMLVGQRARLLRYLRRKDPERYRALIASLGLRK